MKNFLLLTFGLTAITAFLLGCSLSEPAGALEWRNGWVRALPPGAGMTAAYGELRNNSQEIMLVTAYDSNSFAHVSMHQSSMEDGVSRMREIKTVQIAAGESLLLEPGGLHLMLMQPKAGLQVGDRVEIGVDVTGQRFVFSLPVESR